MSEVMSVHHLAANPLQQFQAPEPLILQALKRPESFSKSSNKGVGNDLFSAKSQGVSPPHPWAQNHTDHWRVLQQNRPLKVKWHHNMFLNVSRHWTTWWFLWDAKNCCWLWRPHCGSSKRRSGQRQCCPRVGTPPGHHLFQITASQFAPDYL